MRIKLTVAVLVVSVGLLAFWLWPYSDAFTAAHEAVTDEVVRIVEEDPTPEGVKRAQTYYDSRESGLKEKLDWGLRPDKDGGISETVRTRYYQVLSRARYRVEALSKDHPHLKKDIDYLAVDMTRID